MTATPTDLPPALVERVRRAAGLIRDVPDFPASGVVFRDLTPLLADGPAFRAVIDGLAELAPEADVLVGVEARGFLLAGALATVRGCGVVGVRKPGKLPVVQHRVDYHLEYGSASLELPAAVLGAGQRAVVIDDVLATGGTLAAAAELLERAGCVVPGVCVAVELAGLGGRDRLAGRNPRSLVAL